MYEFYCEIWLEQVFLHLDSETKTFKFGKLEMIFDSLESKNQWKKFYHEAANRRLENLNRFIYTLPSILQCKLAQLKAEREEIFRNAASECALM